MDEPSSGNLRLSVKEILTLFSLLIPAFSLLTRSTSPHSLASLHVERSPTTVPYGTIRSFGDTLSPGTFSAQSHSTSELLRTL